MWKGRTCTTGPRRANHKRAGFEQARWGPPKKKASAHPRQTREGPSKWGEPRQALRGTAGEPDANGPVRPFRVRGGARLNRGTWRAVLKHFTGTHDHKIDDKGRVSLPSDFRRVLEKVNSSEALYIVPGLDDRRAHTVFAVDAYSALIDRHNDFDYDTDLDQEVMEIKLISNARPVQIDDMGRIVVPRELREAIGLDKIVRFVGNASAFQIWRPEDREEFVREREGDGGGVARKINYRGVQ